MSDKAYDDMSMEERAEHDKQAKQKEDDEQASKCIRFGLIDYRLISSTTFGQIALPYKWNQDLTSVSVTVPLPSGTRAKNLTVDIKKQKLKVSVTQRSTRKA